MILRKFGVLFVLLILIGCNQSDSNGKATSADNSSSEQSQSSMNDNTAATETEPERVGKVIARVNGQPIYEDDLNGRNLEYVITEEIIYQEGIRQGMDKQFRHKLRDYERRLIISVTKQSILENAEPTKPISNEQIQSYYELNKDKYTNVRIHEISFADSNFGNEIKDKAKSGEELQTIADSYPDLEITVKDIGFNRDMAKHFKTREVGTVSEVIQKPDGTFSVLKIVEIRDIPLNRSGNAIKHILRSVQKARLFDGYAQIVADENNMTIERIEQDSKQ